MTIQAPKNSWQARVFPLFLLAGWLFILTAFVIGVFVLAPTASAYWGSHAKAVRDSAEIGSTLLNQLSTLASTPRWLVPLAFVGVGSFIVGIALAFSTIPALLKNRGQVMKAVFPLIVKANA